MVGCHEFNLREYPEDRYSTWQEIELKEEFGGFFHLLKSYVGLLKGFCLCSYTIYVSSRILKGFFLSSFCTTGFVGGRR